MPKFHLRRRLLPLAAFRHPRKVFSSRRWTPAVRYFSSRQPKSDAPQRVESDIEQGSEPAKRLPLRHRLAAAWNNTPTKWYPLPVGVGALLLAVLQFRKKSKSDDDEPDDAEESVRLKNNWQVHVLGALPLRNLSRVWGYVNSLELPVWFRPTGFAFYAWVFGCNLDEVEHSDLTVYPSLGEFFYRRLKPGVRPIADAVLVSPADGTVLHFGKIVNARVEQVKGLTYSLDALLGAAEPAPGHESISVEFAARQGAEVDDEHFGNVNGIEYSLDRLLGGNGSREPTTPTGSDSGSPLLSPKRREGPLEDASVPAETTPSHSITVAAEMGSASVPPPLKRSVSVSNVKPGNDLFFTVVYLAPGDYHRFHSPAAWVVEKRRHFVGELFSVSPWVAKRLQNLFVLNERVALLGRWRHGFFGMVPVGATNVGSIKINFDEALRTNVRRRKVSPGAFSEATYTNASPILRGQPLRAGQEMGGFRLGSTIVLVFEAPPTFAFDIKIGDKVKVGEKLGDVPV